MTVCATTETVPALTDVVFADATQDGTLLPVSAWRLHWRVQRNGRAVIEIADDAGDLVGLLTSARLPMLSVDAGWRGSGYDASGIRQPWALAIGHAYANVEEPVVTFTRPIRHRGNPRTTVVRPALLQGLRIAAVPGSYTRISCRQGPENRIRRLTPIPGRRPHSVR
jgi:hypothetical protein